MNDEAIFHFLVKHGMVPMHKGSARVPVIVWRLVGLIGS